ncbi:MAG: zinc ribbon domain-containing protein [Burkholderiales bacterium]
MATVVLAVLTFKYVRLTHSLVQEARAAKRPNVFVDIEFDSTDVKFIIGNTGSSPAINVKLSVADNIPWRQHPEFQSGIASLAIVQNGLAYLAPGRTLKFNAGYIENNATFFSAESMVTIGLMYQTETGEQVSREVTIELRSYSGVLFESFVHPEREVARAIRDAESHRSSRESTKNVTTRFFRQACPSCGENISASAKKCPHCLEFLPSKTE